MSRVLSVLLVGTLATAAFAGVHATTGVLPLDSEVKSLTSKVATTEKKLDSTIDTRDAAVVKRDETNTAYTTRQAVLDARPAFLEAVKGADGAFQSAAGKVDVAGQRGAVIAAQQVVLAERADPAVVAAQTEAVKSAGADAAAQVKAYDDRIAAEKAAAAARAKAQQQQKQSSSQKQTSSAPKTNTNTGGGGGGGGGGGNWFSDLRNRLNGLGGGWVNLVEFDGQCGGTRAAACSYSNGTIAVNSQIAGWSNSRKGWVMAHEFAHQIHFGMWNAVNNSAGYKQLFGSSPELLANCMASARGFTDHGHNGQCYGDRLNWARSLWGGQIPW